MEAFSDFVAGHYPEILRETFQHIWLTFIALGIATAVGVATGIAISRFRRHRSWVLGLVNVIQTIPSLALLGFLLPFIGIGNAPAILALFLYALLPIVRNTFTGIAEVPAAVKEAAVAMGLSDRELLLKVELPLAAPVIFAGIRTATVLCIGVATLCAYIAAGGLGAFIFRGIALNNSSMILAGALPAALLALLFDFSLSLVQRLLHRHSAVVVPAMAALLVLVVAMPFFKSLGSTAQDFVGGFHPEFMERKDGYFGLAETYGLQMETVELDAGLMYQALKEGSVDVIGGYSSDGRIDAYDLYVLEDDRGYFPPYFAAPLVRKETLLRHPKLRGVLNRLSGKLTDAQMRQLNFQVDDKGKSPREAAQDFLNGLGFNTKVVRSGEADLAVGGKNFTEQYILAEMYTILIENYTNLDVAVKTGLGGTKICFEALMAGEIDLYPEYTGTGLLVLHAPPEEVADSLIRDREAVYQYVREKSEEQFGLVWLSPLGFNNSYALMVRKDFAEAEQVKTISDLAEYLRFNK